MAKFHLMTDEQLAAHIERLEYLANTSEETDEYARLMGKLDAARTEAAGRKHGVVQSFAPGEPLTSRYVVR